MDMPRRAPFTLVGAVALPLMMPLITLAHPKAGGTNKESKGQEAAPIFGQLYPGQKTKLPIQGWGGIVFPIECDADGNLYILRAANVEALEMQTAHQGPGGVAITRIKPGSDHLTELDPASPEGYEGYVRPSFYVGPRGSVYDLIMAYKHPLGYHKGPNIPRILVVKYKHDSTIDATTKLDPPPGPYAEAFDFGVFQDGSILLTGNLVSGTPGVSKRLVPTEPFTWLFSRSGAFETSVKLAGDVHAPDKNWTKEGRKGGEWLIAVQGGGILGSMDGTVYLYRASDPVRLYALSSSGYVFRGVTIKPPRPGMQPLQASLTENGQILIEFRGTPSPTDTGWAGIVLELANLQTGKVTGVYKIPPGSGMPACADPQGGFVFLTTSKHGNLAVETFVPQ